MLYGALLFCCYCYGFVGFGVFRILEAGVPQGWNEFFRLALSSMGYFLGVLLLGIPVIGTCIYLVIKDPLLKEMILPFLAMLFVAIFGPFLGPLDETLTLIVGYLWRSFFWKMIPGKKRA